LAKVAKFGKFLLSGGSMLLTIFTYAWIYGWQYAVGFVGLILCHEMGHFLTAKQRGLDVGAPTFIPFVGAWIQLKDQPHDAETEAYIGIAGPMVGTLAAFICFILADGQKGILMALAYAGFVLNLFNLIPVTPLDGGRILGIVSPKLWGFGLLALVGTFFIIPNPLIILIAIVAAPKVWAAWKGESPMPESYYSVSSKVRSKYLIQYLVLVGFLTVMSAGVHETMSGRRDQVMQSHIHSVSPFRAFFRI
jgi:Zn-dependent protease